MKNIFDRAMSVILPFVIAGITIVLFVIGIIVFSYVLLFGALIGLILFAIAFIFAKIKIHQIKKQVKQRTSKQAPFVSPKKGRTIDHDEDT